MTSDGAVSIVEDGRSGEVIYLEAGQELRFYWEFSGGETFASVRVGTGADWREQYPWAAGRRSEILRFVASEVLRQRAPGGASHIDEQTGWMHLRGGRTGSPPAPPASRGFSFQKWQSVRVYFALCLLVVTVIAGAMIWVKNNVLVIDPGKGTLVGSAVRTDRHVAAFIQSLEPYTPSLHRDHSKDTYSISLFVVPLDGTAPRLVRISGGHSGGSLGLIKILGSDARTIWYDVKGVGGIDLATFRLRDSVGPGAPPKDLAGASRFPFEARPEEFLSAGFFTAPNSWLGLCGPADLELEFKPGKWVRPIVSSTNAKVMRQFCRGALGDTASTGSRKIVGMEPVGQAAYLNASFLRTHDKAEPVRLDAPDGALMVYTSKPGLEGTLVVARVDTTGGVLWTVDTGLDRFKLRQILPGESSFAFVGTRIPVPDKVSEPLLVIVDNRTGKMSTHSLWQ